MIILVRNAVKREKRGTKREKSDGKYPAIHFSFFTFCGHFCVFCDKCIADRRYKTKRSTLLFSCLNTSYLSVLILWQIAHSACLHIGLSILSIWMSRKLFRLSLLSGYVYYHSDCLDRLSGIEHCLSGCPSCLQPGHWFHESGILIFLEFLEKVSENPHIRGILIIFQKILGDLCLSQPPPSTVQASSLTTTSLCPFLHFLVSNNRDHPIMVYWKRPRCMTSFSFLI